MSDTERSRTWCFILYPESAPADFDSILRDSMLVGCYSPLHTPDDTYRSHFASFW